MIAQVISEKFDFVGLPLINTRKILILGIISIVSLIILYVFQINEVTKASFLIYKNEAEIAAGVQQVRDLEAGLFAENSLADFESILRELNYEKVNKVYYIKQGNSEMAVRP